MLAKSDIEALRTMMPEYLLARYGVEVQPGKMFSCVDPSHEDVHPSMSYDPKRFTVKCWSQGHGGSVFDLALADGADSFQDAVSLVAEIVGYTLQEYGGKPLTYAQRKGNRKLTPYKHPAPSLVAGENVLDAVIDATINLFDKEGSKARDYLYARGFDDADLLHYGLGLCASPRRVQTEGYGYVQGTSDYLCVPFPDDERFDTVRYCVFRPLHEYRIRDRVLKELKPSNNEYVGGHPLWHEYLLRKADEFAIAEGAFDAMSIEIITGLPCVALMGTQNATRLLGLLERMRTYQRPKTIMLALDNDDAGNCCAEVLRSDAKRLHVRVKESGLTLPDGGDPNMILASMRRGA